jgi:hypothetical protein
LRYDAAQAPRVRPPSSTATILDLATCLGKNAIVAFFPLAHVRSRAAHGSQNNDIRRYFVIASCDPRSPGKYFPGLLEKAEILAASLSPETDSP